jgi:hypothetical protein
MQEQHAIFAQPNVAIVDVEFELRAEIEMLDQSFLTHTLSTQVTSNNGGSARHHPATLGAELGLWEEIQT